MSNWFRAFWILPVLAMAACGGGGGGGGSAPAPNRAPTANFAFNCTDLACTLTSTSTDENVGDAIGSYAWTFGDGTTASTANPTHTFTAAGTYSVGLTVSDTAGLTNAVTRQITVTAAASGPGPHANFTKTCTSLDCTFTDTSTFDAGSVFVSRVWDFGDSSTTATTSSAAHTYAATTLTTFTAKLTVTDAGGKVSTSTQSVTVAPPATSLNCVGGGCSLTLTQPARVTATIVSNACSAIGNEVRITAPVTATLFADGCTAPPNSTAATNGGAPFAAGTTLQFEVRSGISSSATLQFPPTVRVSGSYPQWTLTFDDGYGGAGEPDFNDLVILIIATP